MLENYKANWRQLLIDAITTPGLISRAYSAFHCFSLRNQIAAYAQCLARRIEPGPLRTYAGWKALNRQVRRGERALWLCMPICASVTDERTGEEGARTTFIWKPRWFALAQTEGEEQPLPALPEWDTACALAALSITRAEFRALDGNVQGYAVRRSIAINPVAALPHKTLFHELGHIVLGHTAETDFTDTAQTPPSLREVEAECVALLLCESLSLPGAEYARGYIQNWLRNDVIPEDSATRILTAADKILRAGQPQAESKAA